MEKLDLENVRVYSGTKDDAKDAMDLIGQVSLQFQQNPTPLWCVSKQ